MLRKTKDERQTAGITSFLWGRTQTDYILISASTDGTIKRWGRDMKATDVRWKYLDTIYQTTPRFQYTPYIVVCKLIFKDTAIVVLEDTLLTVYSYPKMTRILTVGFIITKRGVAVAPVKDQIVVTGDTSKILLIDPTGDYHTCTIDELDASSNSATALNTAGITLKKSNVVDMTMPYAWVGPDKLLAFDISVSRLILWERSSSLPYNQRPSSHAQPILTSLNKHFQITRVFDIQHVLYIEVRNDKKYALVRDAVRGTLLVDLTSTAAASPSTPLLADPGCVKQVNLPFPFTWDTLNKGAFCIEGNNITFCPLQN